MRKKIAKIDYIKVFSEFEALLLEAELIKKHRPFFNVQSKDDKSPLYIKISKENIPLVTTTRKTKEVKSTYLVGPFPSAKVTKEILKTVRKIFPYCQHTNPKKPCLYVHLGLCPFPYENKNTRKNYGKTTKKIKTLLSGKSKELTKQLTREMTSFSKDELYERAQDTKDQITKLQTLTTTYHTPKDFLEQPNLVDDKALQKLEDIKNHLGLQSRPERIECYDISNISGTFAVGAMVTFISGQGDKSEYRKFRIKFIDKPNDYEMIKEVLARRFKNNWPKPDLIIIDGGRGHLNSALSVLQKYKLNIPVVSLAKRFEQIYTPHKVMPITLLKESPARQLAQEIRDEAHRFAITYHRLLRSKGLLNF